MSSPVTYFILVTALCPCCSNMHLVGRFHITRQAADVRIKLKGKSEKCGVWEKGGGGDVTVWSRPSFHILSPWRSQSCTRPIPVVSMR